MESYPSNTSTLAELHQPEANIYYLNWALTPFFFLIFMALTIGCWYRRYKLRQQIIEQRHQAGMVQYNGMTGVCVPTTSQPNPNGIGNGINLPNGAYPRQQMPPAYISYGPPEDHLPAYSAEPQISNNQPTETTGGVETAPPPSYDDAIKQPA